MVFYIKLKTIQLDVLSTKNRVRWGMMGGYLKEQNPLSFYKDYQLLSHLIPNIINDKSRWSL